MGLSEGALADRRGGECPDKKGAPAAAQLRSSAVSRFYSSRVAQEKAQGPG